MSLGTAKYAISVGSRRSNFHFLTSSLPHFLEVLMAKAPRISRQSVAHNNNSPQVYGDAYVAVASGPKVLRASTLLGTQRMAAAITTRARRRIEGTTAASVGIKSGM